jgi:hypothetical protein
VSELWSDNSREAVSKLCSCHSRAVVSEAQFRTIVSKLCSDYSRAVVSKLCSDDCRAIMSEMRSDDCRVWCLIYAQIIPGQWRTNCVPRKLAVPRSTYRNSARTFRLS